MFPPIDYLEWISDRLERAEYDLGSSDLRGAGSAVVPELPPSPERPDPIGDVRARLAALYGVDRESVLVTAGATHANFLAFAAALGRGDETESPTVLVEKPGYEPLLATPEGLGGSVRRFVRSADENYRVHPERIEAAVDSPTELVVLTNRHNPSGALSDRNTLRGAAHAAAAAGATLLVDEVYAPFVSEKNVVPNSPFGGVSAAGLPNTVITSSLTKFFGLGSLRIGWLVGPRAFVERARRVAWHVPAVSESSASLAVSALENAAEIGEHARAVLAENHTTLSNFVADRPDLDGFVAPGNSFAFLDHDRGDGDAVAAAARERGVLVVPGRFFDDPERVRVSLGRSPEHVQVGLRVFGKALSDI